MKPISKFKVLLWKELKEISRDKKLIVTTILIPLISLPAIGVFTAALMYYQPVVIALVNQDNSSDYLVKWFTESLESGLKSMGYVVVKVDELGSALKNTTVDIILVIPRGFRENVTSFDKVAYVEVMRRTGVSEERANRAEQDIKSVVAGLSRDISERKVGELASKAGLIVYTPEAIRNPVEVKIPVYITPAGEPARLEDIVKPFIARLLILSFTFIVTPASSFIVDSIVGERERKTMEMLLASPAGLQDLLAAKVVATSIVGLLAALADIAGLLVYFGMLIKALGGWFIAVYDPGLVLLHSLTAFLTILITVAISTPFITRTRGIKTASNIAGLLSVIGLVFFVTGWMVDLYKLPRNILIPLLIIPYTHSVIAIQSYVYGDCVGSLASVCFLAALSMVIVTISLKTLDREKVLLAS